MPHELPAEFDRVLDDLRVVIADIAVDRRGGAYAMLGQHIHDAENTDAVAVIALTPGAHRRRVAGGFFPGMAGVRPVQ